MKGSETIEEGLPRRRGGTRQVIVAAGVFALTASLGCHHKRVRPVLLPPQTPVALVEVPEPDAPPIATPQAPKLPAVPMAEAATKPKKVKKRTPKATPTISPQPVTAGAPAPAKKTTEAVVTPPATAPADEAVVGIGALSIGGEQSPRALQEARDLIAANERRLTAITGDALKSQSELLAKVRNFQRDAQVALHSGDAEGAKTLATKGKLLLDDFDKAGAQ